jgi:beta-phosphoglucomutase-like phosphatase (HAD superfamily)
MGVSTREWATIMRDRVDPDLSLGDIEDAILGALEARYATTRAPEIAGAPDQVRRIGEAVPIALASGAHRRLIDAALAATGLSGAFLAIVSADEVARGKPSPDVYLEAARRIGVDPSACLVVEDSGNGVRAGKAAGMRVVLVPNPHAPPDGATIAVADATLPSLSGLDPTRPPA